MPYVRVLGECTPEPSGPVDAEDVFRFKSLCRFAENFGVTLLIETNGWLAGSNEMLQFIERVDAKRRRAVGYSPHRALLESAPSDGVAVGQIHKHVHKRLVAEQRKITYMLTGYGDIPVEEAYKSLSAIGYDGFYSYEWVKRWSRELAEGVAFTSI